MELQQMLQQVLAQHCNIICNNVRSRWSAMSAIVGQEEIHSDLPQVIGSMVMTTIESSGMAAFIKEFGSGHFIDTSSPYFANYRNSPMWNPMRSASDDYEFLGRSKGATVYRPDGSTYASTGKAEGLHLEHGIGDGERYPGYKAFQASHVIQETIQAEIPELILHLQKTVENYAIAQLTMDLQIYI